MVLINRLFNKSVKEKLPYLFILTIVFLAVAVINFPYGKWLLGWDNLLPEFNFLANFKNSFFAVWQENQGLGLIGGHGFPTTLIHTFYLWILSFILPLQYLRPIFILGMLWLGSVGCFYLAANLLEGRNQKLKYSCALIAGLFYMLNFATVQMFYIPLEAFAYHFAFLPWLLLSILIFLKSQSFKNAVIFALLSLISSPQGFIPPLFVIYFVFSVIIIGFKIFIRRDRFSLKAGITLIAITFIVNAYWLLPLGYYSLTRSHIYLNSYNNLMTTDDFISKNKKFGTMNDLISLKGFIYEAVDAQGSGNIYYIFQPWRSFLEKPLVYGLDYYLFLIILLGVYYAFKSHSEEQKIFAILLILSFTLLAIGIFPLSLISDILSQNLPIFHQMFRIAFTKFSISLVLFYALFLSMGVFILIQRTNKTSEKDEFSRLHYLTITFFCIMILFLAFPAFVGNFFYSRTKLNFPKQYWNLYNFLKTSNDQGRLSDFPQPIATGWSIYRWGYSGSGFLWYGVNNPILDRNFDVWNNFNEDYYWEIAQAVYSGNLSLLESILTKYQISWLMIDENVIGYTPSKSLYIAQLEDLLNRAQNIKLTKPVGNIKLYNVINGINLTNYVFLAKDLPVVGPKYSWNNFDKAYEEYGNYISLESQNSKIKSQNYNSKIKSENNQTEDVYYPFRSLFTGRQQSEVEFGVEDRGDHLSFTAKIPKSLEGESLLIPPVMKEEATEIDANDLGRTIEKYPQVFLDSEMINVTMDNDTMLQKNITQNGGEVVLNHIKDGNLEIRIPKINGYYSANFQPTTYNLKPKSCDQFNNGIYTHEQVKVDEQELLRLTSVGSSNCLDFDLPNLAQRLSYLVTFDSRNVEGKSLLFAAINKNSERADIETYLPSMKRQVESGKLVTSYFVIPPMEQFGVGYSLHVDNISIGREKTVNDLGKISVNPIPYNFLTSLKIVKGDQVFQGSGGNVATDFAVEHPNPSYYQITMGNEKMHECVNGKCTLVLSQSYDNGWHAYEVNSDWLTDSWYMKLIIPLFGKEIKSHVMVNNWENGWDLSKIKDQKSKISEQNQPVTVAIVYIPQYLEYLGFVMLGGLVLYLVLRLNKKDLTT